MGASYRQFCPVAKAMELLDERWTLLLVRELLMGSEHFNDLRRGLPRMSPALLSRRLHQLVAAGLVERLEQDGQVHYRLTDAGHELRPVVEAIGTWGMRWVGELGDPDLDPQLLLWDMHRNIAYDAVPPGRTVVRFHFRDAAPKQREWWLVLAHDAGHDQADVCDSDPGFEVTVTVEGELRSLVRVWLGEASWSGEISGGRLRLTGPTDQRRALPSWFALSPFARSREVTGGARGPGGS